MFTVSQQSQTLTSYGGSPNLLLNLHWANTTQNLLLTGAPACGLELSNFLSHTSGDQAIGYQWTKIPATSRSILVLYTILANADSPEHTAKKTCKYPNTNPLIWSAYR